MTAQVRNYLASLALQHIKHSDPNSLAILKYLAEENFKENQPRESCGYVYRKFLEIKAKRDTTDVI